MVDALMPPPFMVILGMVYYWLYRHCAVLSILWKAFTRPVCRAWQDLLKSLRASQTIFFFPRATHAHTTFNPVYADHLCFYCVFLWVSLDRLEPHFLEELHSWICIICWSKGFVQQGPQIQCPHSPELVENLYDPPMLGCQKQLTSTVRFLHKAHPLTIAAIAALALKLLRGDLQLAAAFPAQRFLPGDSASSTLRPGGQAEVSRRMVLLLHQWLLATTLVMVQNTSVIPSGKLT